MEGPEPRSALQLIFRKPYAPLFWAGFITSTGDWAALFAQISLADSIAGSSGILVVLAARVVPGLIGGAVGGVLADRINRRVAIVGADVGRGLLVLALAFADNLPFLFAVSFLMELLTLLGQPARAAIIPRLVGEQNILAANSLNLTAAYGTFPLGAGVAWLVGLLPPLTLFGLLPATTEATLFALDSVTFILSGLIILTIPIADQVIPDERRRRSRFDWRAPLADFVAGLKFVGKTKQVRGVIVGMAVALIGGGMLIVLGKDFAETTLRADTAGFFGLLFALGTGAALGMLALTAYGDRVLRRDIAFGFTLVVTAVGMIAAALAATVAGAMGWLALMGFGAGGSYVLGFTHLHEQTTDDMRGRTFAALFSLMRVGILVSMIVATNAQAVLQRAGSPFDNPARTVMIGGGLLVLASGLTMVWSLRHHFLNPKPSPEAVESIEAAGRAFRRFGRRNHHPDDE